MGVAHQFYSPGAGRINIPYTKLFAGPLQEGRLVKPLSAEISICLRADTGMVPAESITISLFDLSESEVSKRGPIIIDGRARSFRLVWPSQTQFGSPKQTKTTAVSIFDYGDNSKAGMMVTVRVRALLSTPNVPAASVGERVPLWDYYAPPFGSQTPSRCGDAQVVQCGTVSQPSGLPFPLGGRDPALGCEPTCSLADLPDATMSRPALPLLGPTASGLGLAQCRREQFASARPLGVARGTRLRSRSLGPN